VVTRRGGSLRAQKSPLPETPLDRDRLRQVFANLIGNASKVDASEISIGADLDDSDLIFRVADNGPGIPPEDLPRMFDQYWRGSGTQYKGSHPLVPWMLSLTAAAGVAWK
jgi:signal transduction histidine kinase